MNVGIVGLAFQGTVELFRRQRKIALAQRQLARGDESVGLLRLILLDRIIKSLQHAPRIRAAIGVILSQRDAVG